MTESNRAEGDVPSPAELRAAKAAKGERRREKRGKSGKKTSGKVVVNNYIGPGEPGLIPVKKSHRKLIIGCAVVAAAVILLPHACSPPNSNTPGTGGGPGVSVTTPAPTPTQVTLSHLPPTLSISGIQVQYMGNHEESLNFQVTNNGTAPANNVLFQLDRSHGKAKEPGIIDTTPNTPGCYDVYAQSGPNQGLDTGYQCTSIPVGTSVWIAPLTYQLRDFVGQVKIIVTANGNVPNTLAPALLQEVS